MAELLKNVYDKQLLDDFRSALKRAYPKFKARDFTRDVFDDEWAGRELKRRMRHITHCLHRALPKDFGETVEILLAVAPGFDGLPCLIFPDFVEVYGLDHWDISVPALREFTKYSSSELAVRPFIIQDAGRMMRQMERWSRHKNVHVRRLASEGCRPRLPWAQALPEFKKDPSPILPILENLKRDKEKYVQKSVANNLNDIAKDHPRKVIELTKAWKGESPETDWIVKHGCRTLLKKGNAKALALFGFSDANGIDIKNLKVGKASLKIGDNLAFSFELRIKGKKARQARLEYGIDFVKSNGSRNRKIFKIGEKKFAPGEYNYSRNQSFKNFTTRKHYPGKHALSVIINGVEKASTPFDLKA